MLSNLTSSKKRKYFLLTDPNLSDWNKMCCAVDPYDAINQFLLKRNWWYLDEIIEQNKSNGIFHIEGKNFDYGFDCFVTEIPKPNFSLLD